MKVVSGPNLGVSPKDPFTLMDSKRPTKEPGIAGGEPYSNKLQIKTEKQSKATDLSQGVDLYRVKGAFVDKLA